jgi:hypothetical protein
MGLPSNMAWSRPSPMGGHGERTASIIMSGAANLAKGITPHTASIPHLHVYRRKRNVGMASGKWLAIAVRANPAARLAPNGGRH